MIENFQQRLTKVQRSNKMQDVGYVSQKEEPNSQYEILRRRILSNTHEFWYFVSSELINVQKRANDVLPEVSKALDHVLNMGAEHKRFVARFRFLSA